MDQTCQPVRRPRPISGCCIHTAPTKLGWERENWRKFNPLQVQCGASKLSTRISCCLVVFSSRKGELSVKKRGKKAMKHNITTLCKENHSRKVNNQIFNIIYRKRPLSDPPPPPPPANTQNTGSETSKISYTVLSTGP